jgi:hypothetical protein
MKKDGLKVRNEAVEYFAAKIAKSFKTEDVVLDNFADKSWLPMKRFYGRRHPDFIINLGSLTWVIGKVEKTELGYICFIKIVQAKQNPDKYYDERDKWQYSQSNFVLLPYIFPQFTRSWEPYGVLLFEEDGFMIKISPEAIWNNVRRFEPFVVEINLTILHELFHLLLDSIIKEDVVEHMVQVLSGRK